MFSKAIIAAICAITLGASSAEARIRWLERDGRAIFLHPRRFGQEHPPVIDKIAAACPGEVCGSLSGQAITPLLAAQGECTQQDMADAIIDASRQFDAATQANMIALAQEYRQAEKNTPPDFTTNPPTLRNSVFCQNAPSNPELDGLVQAQDPANDPNIFFDPATRASVLLGSQPNTFPFGQSGDGTTPEPELSAPAATLIATSTSASEPAATSSSSSTDDSSTCNAVETVTVTAGGDTATSTEVASSTTSLDATPTQITTPDAGDIGDFGSCTVPEIEFGVGFDGRTETSFRPVDLQSYNHGSAQNINIITQFICDTLVNSCGADQTAQDTCADARVAASGAATGTGAQADAFNAVFGIETNFVDIASVDNQGNIVPGTGSGSTTAPADESSTTDVATSTSPVVDVTTTSSVVDATTTLSSVAASSSDVSSAPAPTQTAAVPSGNLQTFTGALGGVTAPAVTALADGRFQVDGNAALNNAVNAVVRSCDVQNNRCADAANASGNQGDLTVASCGDQQSQCIALAQSA